MTTQHPGAPSSVIAIVQARLGSVRMPGKVLDQILGKPLVAHLSDRLGNSPMVQKTILAIPSSSVNDELAEVAAGLGLEVFRGSELDVLDRYSEAAKAFPAEAYVRIIN